LGGKPSITRLQEQTEQAPAHILGQLESYAAYEVGRQRVKVDGSIRVLGRNAQLDVAAHGQNVTMYETLRGLEVKTQEGRWYLFPDSQCFRQLSFTAPWNMPASFAFERCQGSKLATTSWLIVIFGEPELDRALQRAALSPAPETEWFSSPYGHGKSAPHANRRHGRREPIVSSSPSPVARSS
jgi:hypothetical protein